MTPTELMQLADVLHAHALPQLVPFRLDSENVAKAIAAIEDLRDTLAYAFADIDTLQGYVVEEEERELRRAIEFRHNVILGGAL